MPGTIIAFSGKGGSGKTTLAAMCLRHLVRTGRKPVLAVDADPNATLALTLGIDPGETIADVRDAMGEAALEPSRIPKHRLMEQWLAEVLCEESGFDLLTMGRPEGPKCYCYVNGLLRRYLKELRGNYPYVIVDCEAGMEYLSRLVVDDIEAIVLVSEATKVGLASAERIVRLAESLPIKVKRHVLAVNKVGPEAEGYSDLPAVESVVRVPFDPDIAARCARGDPVDDDAGPDARQAVEQLTQCFLGLSPKHEASAG